MDTQKSKASLITKAGLAACLLLGLVFIFLGIRGRQKLSSEALSTEESYQAIYALSGDLSAAWNGSLSADLESLGAEVRKLLEEKASARKTPEPCGRCCMFPPW